MFDAVIFDWDGTLADSKRYIVSSFQKVLREIGCRVSDEFIERLIGIGPRNIFKEALKANRMPFDEEMIDELMGKKIEIQIRLTRSVELFEGAIELLSSLHKRVKVALATMSNRRVVDRILDEKGIKKYFDVIVTVDEVTQPKPNPEIFLKCAEKLKCSPKRCVVIEDSVFGIRAAKEAGMMCIAVPTGAYSIEELQEQKPDLTVRSINKKDDILGFIFNRCNSKLKPEVNRY